MVSSELVNNIIFLLHSWFNNLASATSTIIDLLSKEVVPGSGLSIGGSIFGAGVTVFVGYVVIKWAIDIFG